jgi:hypothetical protein
MKRRPKEAVMKVNDSFFGRNTFAFQFKKNTQLLLLWSGYK